MEKYSKIQIGKLFNQLLDEGNEIKKFKDYDLIDCSSLKLETRTLNGWVPVRFISRHKTKKHLIEIVVKTFDGNPRKLIVTTDHVCMVYDKDWILEERSAKNLRINDYVNVYLEDFGLDDTLGTIISITDLGETEDYVYDMEMDDENCHWFFSNDVLVHNSQFVNIQYITNYFIEKFSLPERLMDWPDEYKLKLWKFVEKFVEEKVNPFVQNLVKEHCFTEHPEVLHYSLEYLADSGIYEQKKRYCVHKMVEEGPILVNKFKYTGIELKKAIVPVEIKDFLRDIYENSVVNNWTSQDYKKYLDGAYEKFCKMSINEISFWRKWSSDKIEAEGFLKFGKGTTGLSKACKTYNQMISQLKLGKKYDTINLGDQIRYCYVCPSNQFGIEIIAFKTDSWPKEFNKYFQVDYQKMFEKIVLDPLKSFRIATNFTNYSPTSKPCDDVFSL